MPLHHHHCASFSRPPSSSTQSMQSQLQPRSHTTRNANASSWCCTLEPSHSLPQTLVSYPKNALPLCYLSSCWSLRSIWVKHKLVLVCHTSYKIEYLKKNLSLMHLGTRHAVLLFVLKRQNSSWDNSAQCHKKIERVRVRQARRYAFIIESNATSSSTSATSPRERERETAERQAKEYTKLWCWSVTTWRARVTTSSGIHLHKLSFMSALGGCGGGEHLRRLVRN